MMNEKKAANAMGGKTARACDGCLRKRARWFCAADDAFLCQACDSSVHSANQLASRHERLRLDTASSKTALSHKTQSSPPAWHQGFTRKARTPRHNNNKSLLVQQQLKLDEQEEKNMMINNPFPLVPELSSEEEGNMLGDENCRVPVFDPFEAQLCEILTSDEGNDVVVTDQDGNYRREGTCSGSELHNLQGFLPSDMDLAEFAADVENLLGEGLDEDYNLRNDVKEIERLLDCKEEEDDDNDEKFGLQDQVVKIKDEVEMESITESHFCEEFDMSRVSLMDWNFDYESPMTGDDEEEEKAAAVAVEAQVTASDGKKKEMKRSISLRLNYEAVITAWSTQRSPWTTGSRPQLNPDDDSWPNCTDAWHKDGEGYGGGIGAQKRGGGGDGGREARVMRYKEKRRTRLFSKKIRYQVRKLNAEKRPRMKGRFVKRTSFMGSAAASAYLCINK